MQDDEGFACKMLLIFLNRIQKFKFLVNFQSDIIIQRKLFIYFHIPKFEIFWDVTDDLPSPGRNFPGRFLPTEELSLSVCFLPCRGGGSLILPPVLGFQGRQYT
jgi:hypothetical protein